MGQPVYISPVSRINHLLLVYSPYRTPEILLLSLLRNTLVVLHARPTRCICRRGQWSLCSRRRPPPVSMGWVWGDLCLKLSLSSGYRAPNSRRTGWQGGFKCAELFRGCGRLGVKKRYKWRWLLLFCWCFFYFYFLSAPWWMLFTPEAVLKHFSSWKCVCERYG